MGQAFARYIARTDAAGTVGIGGGGGTAIVTEGMQQLALGVPKLMVSDLASGDVSAFVGASDIVMMPSITDMAGLNGLSRIILNNAAQAITAMAVHLPRVAKISRRSADYVRRHYPLRDGITKQLGSEYDCLVFHATGTGGRTVEKLADSACSGGMLDITTTEVCDLLFGGVLAATQIASAPSPAPACPARCRSAPAT